MKTLIDEQVIKDAVAGHILEKLNLSADPTTMEWKLAWSRGEACGVEGLVVELKKRR
jgi:hypothetical protein